MTYLWKGFCAFSPSCCC